MSYFDINLKHDKINKLAGSFGLNINEFLSLPKEYREAFIRGDFIIDKNVLNNFNKKEDKIKILLKNK